jgi:hypothetical protein
MPEGSTEINDLAAAGGDSLLRFITASFSFSGFLAQLVEQRTLNP